MTYEPNSIRNSFSAWLDWSSWALPLRVDINSGGIAKFEIEIQVGPFGVAWAHW